jgi:hypothetical protein
MSRSNQVVDDRRDVVDAAEAAVEGTVVVGHEVLRVG